VDLSVGPQLGLGLPFDRRLALELRLS